MPAAALTPRREALVVAVIVLAVYLSASLSGALVVGAWNDDGVYVVLGKALATGQGYHSLHLVGQPVQVKYPPGFPFILSVLWWLSPSPEGVQRLVGVLHPAVVSAAAGLLWWFGRVRLQLGIAVLSLLVILPLMLDASIQYFTIPLSEPWFILGWAGFLVLWSENVRTERPTPPLGLLLAAGSLAAATMLVRTQGIVLVAVTLAPLLTRRWSLQGRMTLALSALTPLAIWYLVHGAMVRKGPVADLPDEGSYLAWFLGAGLGESLRRIGTGAFSNAAKYLEQLGPYFAPVPWLGRLVVGAALGFLLIASLRALRRTPVPSFTALGVLGIVLLWPFAQDRLLLAALPFLGLSAGIGVADLVGRLAPQVRRAARAAVFALMGLILLRQVSVHRQSLAAFAERRPPDFYSPSHLLPLTSRYLVSAIRWVQGNTQESERLLIDYPAAIYLYTGRLTMPANPSESAVQASVFAVPGRYLAKHILRDSIDVVVVGIPGSLIIRDIQEIQLRCPGVLHWVGTESGNFPLRFRVISDPECLRH